MQIRLYSRQDDKEFRKLMQSIYQSKGSELDLDGKDNDLRNLVAEDDGVIHGFCGARIEPGTKVNTETLSLNATTEAARDTLFIKRLYVSPEIENHQELVDKLLNVVKNHAYQLDFETVLLPNS